ncbi:MAG: hypothetical protein D3924_06995 [Candidatus Electrothrix sp. AR4]|nr:hypothetical protein [Candidatus Electrothrix sp. AR4]
MKINKLLAICLGMSICTFGCGPDLPFEAKYTSKNQVIITYKGKQYTLDRYGIPAQTPFTYRFEDDGDIDLTIDGQVYDVDSPYDRDKKKVKKKVKKKTTRKKTVKKKSPSKNSKR